ncbi:MAG: DUF4405 domain-containing protein [Firmicutes bacterium]|nr:DUF4405 domain-containing protein [Bacillota bacterium]
MMYRQRVLLLVSVLLLLVGAVSLYTGVVLQWLMPPGGARSGWDWTPGARSNLRDIHTWSGIVLAGLSVIHVVLNWDWVINAVRRVLRQPDRPD